MESLGVWGNEPVEWGVSLHGYSGPKPCLPADEILGIRVGVLEPQKSWGRKGGGWGRGRETQCRASNVLVYIIHTRLSPHLGPKHAHLHMFTSTHSCTDHTCVCLSLRMLRLLKTYSLPDSLPLPSTRSPGGQGPWHTLRSEQGTRGHFCTLLNQPCLHPWVNKYFLNTYSSTNSFGALTGHQALC